MTIYSAAYRVSFGDCDPAGLVFYPNFFAWLDDTFHGFLKAQAGGHHALCTALEAKGIGLVSAESDFRVPVTDGDELTISLDSIAWDARRFTLHYTGLVGDRTGKVVCHVCIAVAGRPAAFPVVAHVDGDHGACFPQTFRDHAPVARRAKKPVRDDKRGTAAVALCDLGELHRLDQRPG